jgi:hypothetical protein
MRFGELISISEKALKKGNADLQSLLTEIKGSREGA